MHGMDLTPLTPVRLPKTAEVLADVLRRRVLDGELSPGDRLPSEAGLMTRYQVSRPTVREALRLLEAEELVEVRRGARGGPVVRRPSEAPALRALAVWLALGEPDEVSPVPPDELAADVLRAVRRTRARRRTSAA
jgi:DNA-binding FadR family transcriptional regulator